MKTTIFTIAVLVSVLALASAHGADEDSNTEALPDDFPEFIITQNGETAPGYLIGSVNSENPEVGSYFMIMDNAGVPVFYSNTQSLGGLVCNGLFASKRDVPGMRKKVSYYLQDEDFNEVDTFQAGNGYLADGHDFQVLPNGHVLILIYNSHIIDMSQIVEGGHPAATVSGAVIQELDVYKNVIFQWRSVDYIPITDSYRDITRRNFGYIHVNAVKLDETDGNIILCCRETSEVIKISRVTGEVMWRMGGKNNEFTFINEHEENAPQYFRVPHDVHRHANGHLTMFDNGNDEQIGEGRTYSRGVEYDLDEENKTATMVWEYRNDPDILALTGGNCTRLSNGNTIIRWGGAAKTGDAPAMTEADPNGQLVYEIWPAQEGVTGGFSRCIWPLSTLAKQLVANEVYIGNTYRFAYGGTDTGVSIKINDMTGYVYNAMGVKRYPFAPLYPEFPGKAPRVLPVCVYVGGYLIISIDAQISFDVGSYGFTNPEALTVYQRKSVDQGMFVPLETSYNPVTKKLRATMTSFGEFIFCFPNLEEVAYAPILIEPENESLVNQELPVSFFWTPRGFGRSYHLQVATDAQFDTLVVDDPNLIETRYVLEDIQPNTRCYWRVCTTNYGGTGEWSEDWLETVPPMVQVTVPNGSEQWQRGLRYFIQWDDNLAEDVVIELYKGESLLQAIDTVSSIGAYEWEVNLELETGDDYFIKVKSSVDETLFDVSDAPFTIIDATETEAQE